MVPARKTFFQQGPSGRKVCMEDEFWAPRASFRRPIPEVEVAADLLTLAVDRLLVHDEINARSYIEQANMPLLRAYTRSIASQVTRDIHRFREVPGLAAAVSKSERGPRQPPPATALDIYNRDGFRCRYCSCRVVHPRAQGIIAKFIPRSVQWGATDAELNAAFYTLKGVLDHVDPHAHGGKSDADNLVVSCQPCNYGKGNWFTRQLGLSDPRLRAPQVDDWDGLLRVRAIQPATVMAVAKTAQLPKIVERPQHIDAFAAAFSAADRRHLDALLEVLKSCGALGVFWTVKRVLLVKIQCEDITLSAIGVQPDANVQIPWSIGSYKQAFRSFAETLAAGLLDATVCETEKMWRVRCSNRLPRLSELMHDPEALRDAFIVLRHQLLNSRK